MPASLPLFALCLQEEPHYLPCMLCRVEVRCVHVDSSAQPSEWGGFVEFHDGHTPFDSCLDIFWCAVCMHTGTNTSVYSFKEALWSVF